MWTLLWLACQTPCAVRAAGAARDRCTYEEVLLLEPTQVEQVRTQLDVIDDPIVRGAAVMTWVGKHGPRLDPTQGQALCETLEGPDQGRCLRRLQSAHLKR